MHARSPAAEPDRQSDLNMTPMIDVVFQLLIFFMLSMHFKEVEGRLITTLPRTWGPSSSSAELLDEVRVVICAGGEVRSHLEDKGAHEKAIKDATTCRLLVERVDIGALALEQPDRKRLYREAAARSRELGALMSKPRYVIDADSEVPYEHVVGVVNALKEVRIESIEFAANPRFARLIP